MGTFLFDEVIFGPIKSRRLGESLGINLLPTDRKVCNFDCIYCECGLTDSTKGKFVSRQQVAEKLEGFLRNSLKENRQIDAITFAGNGEPTLHADFNAIIDDTYRLRNTFYPKAKIALLTNATTIASSKVQEAFGKIDQNILKLDSVNKSTIDIINCPIGNYNIEKIIEILISMKNPIIQTMFITGNYKGKIVDNTTEEEVSAWLGVLDQIKPSLVMIYTIARNTPIETLEKVPLSKLKEIGSRIEELGFEVQISG